MAVTVRASGLAEISPLRTLYREETNCQIIHGSIRVRPGWTREFALVQEDGTLIGYGSVAVAGPWRENPALYEFFIPRELRARTFELFATLLPVCGARIIETQSNEPILPVLLHTFTRNIRAESILFEDAIQTAHQPPGAAFRTVTAEDRELLRQRELDDGACCVVTSNSEIAGDMPA